MAGRMSRIYVVNRAFVADRWLTANHGVSVAEADEGHLKSFLESLPPSERLVTWEALCAYWDDLVRRGAATRNAARGIRVRA